MKKKILALSMILGLSLITATPTNSFADTKQTSHQQMNHSQMNHDQHQNINNNFKKYNINSTGIQQQNMTMNEEMIKQFENFETHNKKSVQKAIENNEKVYTAQEILNSNAKAINVSPAQFEHIKKVLSEHLEGLKDITSIAVKQNMTKTEYLEMTKRVEIEINRTFTLEDIHSIIQDKNNNTKSSSETTSHENHQTKNIKSNDIINYYDSHDGGGGGDFRCNDFNGWGYKSFIDSDCYRALIRFKACAADIASKMYSGIDRYCKLYVNNCSPLIGHRSAVHYH